MAVFAHDVLQSVWEIGVWHYRDDRPAMLFRIEEIGSGAKVFSELARLIGRLKLDRPAIILLKAYNPLRAIEEPILFNVETHFILLSAIRWIDDMIYTIWRQAIIIHRQALY